LRKLYRKEGGRVGKLENRVRKYPYASEDTKFGSPLLSGEKQLHYSYSAPYRQIAKPLAPL